MNQPEPTATAPPSQPPQDQPNRPIPLSITNLLNVLEVLLGYGRHLALTLEVRAAAGRFAVLAQFFGTARLPVIHARLTRGLLRIQALQRVLLDRARRGRDLVWLKPIVRAPRQPRPPLGQAAAPDAQSPGAASPDAPSPDAPTVAAPLRRRPDPDAIDPDHLPTLAQLEAQIRRRPIGRTVADICRDLGIGPLLCDCRLWGALLDGICWYRGNLRRFFVDAKRREVAFMPEWDRDATLGQPERSREAVAEVLGFFIGERWPCLPDPLPPPLRMAGLAAVPRPP